MTNKTCYTCNIEKVLSDFHKRKDSKDGFRNNCKSCHYLLTKELNKKFRNKPESKLKNKLRSSKYWEENKEIIKKENKLWLGY